MSEETKKTPRAISRREFLRDAGIVVGGTAVSSALFLSACGKEVEVTKTVTTTAPGSTVITTAPGTTSTVTKTAAGSTVTKYACPVCNKEFDSLEALKAHYDSVHETTASVTGNTIKLTVNRELYEVMVESQTTLYSLLHRLGWMGVKRFCDRGACGSCTAIVNGRPILTCMALACEFDGAIIETAEGIAKDKHPLIEAYVQNDCMQCGYCTPGFVTTAKALLDRNPNPTEEEVVEAIAGNLCRCGTYPQHTIAILEAAKNL